MRSVLYLFFICCFLLLFLHIPSVQSWIANKVVSGLTSSVNGTINIDKTQLDVYQGVTIAGMTILDERQDTLVAIDHIKVSPKNTLISLIRNELALNNIYFKGVHVFIRKHSDMDQYNWEGFVVQQDDDDTSESGGLPVEFSALRISDFALTLKDDHKKEYVDATFASFEMDIDSLDVSDDLNISISRLLLDQPNIVYQKDESSAESSEDITTSEGNKIDKNSPLKMLINIDDLKVINANATITKGKGEVNRVTELDLILKDVLFEDQYNWSLIVEKLSGQNDADEISYASIERIKNVNGLVDIKRGILNLNNSQIKFDGKAENLTDLSSIGDLKLDLSILPSVLYFEDLYSVVPALKKEFYGQPISKKRLQIEGDFAMQNNDFKGEGISIWLNGLHHFEGDFSFEKSNSFFESILTANVTNLYTNVADLASMSTKFTMPKELTRLETVDFSGSFDGFLNDFVANGLLKSPLGKANLDIKFDLSGEGVSSVNYDGFLSLDSFDLKRMTLDDQFGIVSAKVNINNGEGSDLSSSSADIRAVIDHFEFKDFVYKDAVFDGKLSSKVIDGQFNIEDEELDFEFDGIVDLSDSIAVFDFKVNANKINFCQLNLTEFPCQLAFSSDINLKGNTLSELDGVAIINDAVVVHDTSSLNINRIKIQSLPGKIANSFYVNSDYIDFDIEGRFNLLQVFQNTIDQIVANVEEHNAIWNYEMKGGQDVNQKYRFSLLLKESTPLFKFLNLNVEQRGFASITGGQNGDHGMVDLQAAIPYISYNNISADSVALNLTSRDRIAVASAQLFNLKRDDVTLPEFKFVAAIDEAIADWSFKYSYDEYNKARVLAQSSVGDDGYFTIVKEDNIIIDSSRWTVESAKGIGIYPGAIDIEDFTLTDGSRFVSLKDVDNKGLEVNLKDFQLGFINAFINYDKTILTGKVESTLVVEDIYKNRALEGFINVADFKVNGDDFGELSLVLDKKNEFENLINLDLKIEKDTQNLYAAGYANLDSSYLDVNIDIQDYPMSFFEYIIEDGISQTIGTTDIQANLTGDISDLKLSGIGEIKDAGVKVDFLGAFYRMDDQTVTLDERFIDFSGVEMIDEMGNTAVIEGGLRHKILADIRADLSISSPRFIGLNTTSIDNPLYYGTGVGELDISFKGPFDAIDIVVSAELQNLSHLYIPLATTAYEYDKSFIIFNSSEDTTQSLDVESLAELLKDQGVDFEMSLTFTPEARVSIIYDETTSNVLEGTGTGNLQINVKRDGEFSAYGTYNVLSGQYLYTAYGLIAKPFVISNGGTVTWTGDPLNATLDVTAQYPSLRAPLDNLISEFDILSDAELSARRQIDLKLILTGQLFNPNIDFDIDFPNLIGRVRTFAQNKVRTLKATENGINNQVVGLMVFNNFLPDNNGLAAISSQEVGQTGTNTITQYLTSQLSIFFSDYLSSKLSGDVISAIDLEIGVAQNSSLLGPEANLVEGLLDVVPDEVQLNLRNHFKNDNFVLNLGGNYIRENSLATAENYVTGDFSLDWFITDDRRLKLRFYGNYDYDDALSTRRQRYGFGINFRKEFGSITDFEKVMDEMIRQIQEEVKTTPTTTSDN